MTHGVRCLHSLYNIGDENIRLKKLIDCCWRYTTTTTTNNNNHNDDHHRNHNNEKVSYSLSAFHVVCALQPLKCEWTSNIRHKKHSKIQQSERERKRERETDRDREREREKERERDRQRQRQRDRGRHRERKREREREWLNFIFQRDTSTQVDFLPYLQYNC